MKNLIITGFVCLASLGTASVAQQALWDSDNIVSPEVGKDNRVTFRVYAPFAKSVRVSGEWIANAQPDYGSKAMTKDSMGLWSYTSEPLPSDLYSYSFLIDSVKTIDQSNVYVDRDVASRFNIFIAENGKGDLYKVNNVPHGSVTHRWYKSPNNTFAPTRRITIYTPPQYDDNKDKDYPVLYLLHGMGGDEEAWITLGRATRILDNLIARGEAEPMIVVMPNGNVIQEAAPGESEQGMYKPVMRLPHSMDGMFELTFPDIMTFVENNYRTQKVASGRAIAGLSMGGFHALHISRFYPDTFDYVGLFSPAVNPLDTTSSGGYVYDNMEETLTTQKNLGYKLYQIAIGKDDFLYDEVANYRKKLDSMDMPYAYTESEGGHTWTNWRTYLSEFVQKLFK